MKHLFACILLAMCLQATENPIRQPRRFSTSTRVKNVFIITIDGFRWQEVFNGADSAVISGQASTFDTETIKLMYWAPTAEERRKKLMPFFWNVLAKKGQLYGNRAFDNRVNVSNLYSLSYPGYNEIFAGQPDLTISSNQKRINSNLSVLEWLNGLPAYKGHVVAFTSWNVFPLILNQQRSRIIMNCGYEDMEEGDSMQSVVNRVQKDAIYNKTETRQDELTFITAKEYIRKFEPSIVYLGFGETDEVGHVGRYDLYLEKAAKIDKMLAELWHLVQSTPCYRNNTTFIITTDHGRGISSEKWSKHGLFVSGSSQTWLALIGPNITPLGEMKNKQQIYQKQIAQTIAMLVGENFRAGRHVAPGIAFK